MELDAKQSKFTMMAEILPDNDRTRAIVAERNAERDKRKDEEEQKKALADRKNREAKKQAKDAQRIAMMQQAEAEEAAVK